ncbi:hypothetical protein chiPu_0033853, partial [Chiloscyllium punctatum]|nr:hypothetical protein [Chiloscyllium punctatum]
IVARAPAAVGADVEATPVIDRSNYRRRLGVGACREVGRRSGRCERNQGNRTEQKLLHFKTPSRSASKRVPKPISDASAHLMVDIYTLIQPETPVDEPAGRRDRNRPAVLSPWSPLRLVVANKTGTLSAAVLYPR